MVQVVVRPLAVLSLLLVPLLLLQSRRQEPSQMMGSAVSGAQNKAHLTDPEAATALAHPLQAAPIALACS